MIIVAEGLEQTYMSGGQPLTVLKDIDLQVEARSAIAIVGPSGSGKTTLLGLLAGLDLPSAGHVILDDQNLNGLSEDQRARTKSLFEAMKAEAVPIGERIIAEEMTLDHLFAERAVTRAALDTAVARIASAQGDLRAAHLRYHLAMTEVLTAGQIARYSALRGYAAGGHH